MTVTVGRVRFAAAQAGAPSSLGHTGDRLTLAADVLPSTLIEAKVMRQQLLGLSNNADEPIVPVTVSDDPDVDGFYRVLGVRVDPTEVYLLNNHMRAQIDLERVGGGYAKPAFEMAIVAPIRTNAIGFTGVASIGIGVTAGPDVPNDRDDLFDTGRFGGNTVESADGDLRVYGFLTSAATAGPHTIGWFARPSTFYRGSTLIEVQRGGVWYPVVGRQIPEGTGGLWRISNGLIRFGPSAGTFGRGVLEMYDTTTNGWVTLTTGGGGWRRGIGAFTEHEAFTVNPLSATAYVDPVLLRNDHATVTVRIPGTGGSSETYTIQRGRRCIEIEFTHVNNSSQLAARMGEAATAMSTFGSGYGLVRSADDANGCRWFMASPGGMTIDTTNGGFRLTSAALTLSMCVGGVETAATSSFDQETSDYLLGTTISGAIVAR